MPKAVKDKKQGTDNPVDTVALITEAVGTDDPDVLLFFAKYLECGLSAKDAYQALHPGVTEGSAKTLGSRMLTRVDRTLVLEAWGLGTDAYIGQLRDGLNAMKVISARVSPSKKTKGLAGDSEQEWEANENTDDFIEVPDHIARKPYHDKLGKLLGIENQAEQGGGPTLIVDARKYIQNNIAG